VAGGGPRRVPAVGADAGVGRVRRLSVPWLLLMVMVVSGCMVATAQRDHELGDGSKDGVVIVSFTQPYRTVKWMYRDVTKSKGIPRLTQRFVLTRIAPDVSEPIEDGDTWIFALVLPRGEYEFYQWNEPENYWYYEGSTADFSVRFTSVPGTATYVGNLHLVRDGRTFRMMARDRREREISLFRTHYPKMARAHIETDLMRILDPGTAAETVPPLIARPAR
jgi:hypothetical protein